MAASVLKYWMRAAPTSIGRLDRTAATPSTVRAGAQVTIAGAGFDPVPSNNLVTVGSQLATVASVSAGGTSMTITVPPGLAAGPATIVLMANGQTSNALQCAISP